MHEKTEQICSELGSLPDETSRTTFLERHPELIQAEVVKELAEAVRAAVRVDVRKALSMAEAALTIARGLGTREELALASRAKANALWVMADCKSAVELYREAAALFERAGNRNELARTLSSSIQAHALLGEYGQAFAAAERAREIFTGLGESWRVARLDINVANIFHRQNRYSEALALYERAYQQLLPHRDMEGISAALHNIAVCLIALDDFGRALATYRQVRDFCERHNMPLIAGQADYNIAFLYYLRGDYNKALDLLRSTREACRQSGDIYHLGLCDLDCSEIYLELSLTEEAADMAQNSLEHFEHLGMKFESARSLTNLAIATSLQGDGNRALELFARSKDIARSENNQVWSHITDLYRALVLFDQAEYSEARDLVIPAAEFFRSARMHSKYVLCLLLLTRIYLRTGEIDQAARCSDEASRALENLDTPILSYQAQFLRGQIYEAQGQSEKAYSSYQESRTALEALRSSLQREELKLGFMRNRLDVYSRLIQMCLDRASAELPLEWRDEARTDALEEALSYVEAAKSRTLRDLILGGAQPRSGGSEENETDRHLRDLRKELNWYYHRIEREQLSRDVVPREDIESLRRQARTREHQLMRLLLEAPTPTAIGLALRNSSAATLQEIRRALPPQAALLEYFAIGEQVFAAVVKVDFLEIVPVASISAVAHRLKLLQFQLSKFRLDGEYVARFQQALLSAAQIHLHGLYDDLIGPLESLLRVRDLVIVPFGPLHSLPFHALFDGQAYLIDRFGISYVPSASIFAHDLGRAEESGPIPDLGGE